MTINENNLSDYEIVHVSMTVAENGAWSMDDQEEAFSVELDKEFRENWY